MRSTLSIIFYSIYVLCVVSLPISLLVNAIIFIFHLIIITTSVMWIISHYLGLCHETRYVLYVLLCSSNKIVHIIFVAVYVLIPYKIILVFVGWYILLFDGVCDLLNFNIRLSFIYQHHDKICTRHAQSWKIDLPAKLEAFDIVVQHQTCKLCYSLDKSFFSSVVSVVISVFCACHYDSVCDITLW